VAPGTPTSVDQWPRKKKNQIKITTPSGNPAIHIKAGTKTRPLNFSFARWILSVIADLLLDPTLSKTRSKSERVEIADGGSR
jgi:hypothetical protein